jgi:hypothetical protein
VTTYVERHVVTANAGRAAAIPRNGGNHRELTPPADKNTTCAPGIYASDLQAGACGEIVMLGTTFHDPTIDQPPRQVIPQHGYGVAGSCWKLALGWLPAEATRGHPDG